MYTIGIELNHVVRNINKQLLKFYAKDFHPELDLDTIDENSDVINDVIKFDSKFDKSNFVYVNYPFEIFGSAQAMERNLARDITAWQNDLNERDDNDYRIIYYSLYEDELTIQSTYFFLSKIGTRVREVFFPTNIQEVYDKCDAIITSNKEVINFETDTEAKKVLIRKPYNEDLEKSADFVYNSLSEVLADKEIIEKLTKENG